jgi:predicted phage terminase large subunit-like protein
MLGRNPEMPLIGCVHTHDLAVSMNHDVQRIMTGDAYKRVFSATTVNDKPTRLSAGIVARRTMDLFEIPGRRGSLRSAWVGGSIVGNSADGAIIDDPFGKREDADSPAVRQRIWDWYANDLHTRLSANAWIVLTHTRWHRDDLAGRLLRKMADRAADQWEMLCLPALREAGAGDPADIRQPGEALWREFKSAADLEVIRQQDARAFAGLYQQNPSEASAAEWAPELFGDWIWVQPCRWPRNFDLSVVCLDPSKGQSDKQGDYCAIVFMGIAPDRLLYVDAFIERIPLDQIVRKAVVLCQQWRPNYIGIEADQFQELLVHEFRRVFDGGMGVHCPICMMRTRGIPKIARIRQLSQYVIHRELRFKADSPGCRLLVDQLMDFPLAEHDDGPDALQMCTRLPLELVKG